MFYDSILTKDSTISLQAATIPILPLLIQDHALSHGINDLIGTRKCSCTDESGMAKSFMWDGARPPLGHAGAFHYQSNRNEQDFSLVIGKPKNIYTLDYFTLHLVIV
ncbi:MAG: hypothetical protein IPG87_12840 [Saprospiraceae bacterium]|nr:hypothetical protein [Candidatus Vicinibacter affinis]